VLAGYFFLSFSREMMQLGLSMLMGSGIIDGLSDYFFDFWNVLDLLSLTGFFFGLFQRYECTLQGPVCVWVELYGATGDAGTSPPAPARRIHDAGAHVAAAAAAATHIRKSSGGSFDPPAESAGGEGGGEGGEDFLHHSPWELWALCYAICLLCCWFRVLRSFYLSNLGLIVSIFMAMMADVAQFVIFYVILVLAMSMVFLGVGDPKYLLPDNCGDDALYMSCRHNAYWFMRTLFQSFGEFFLEELDNDASVIFLIITFLVLNIVLMNLLIAMMASTYEKVLEAASAQRLEDTYDLMTEHSRAAMAAPLPFNVFTGILEVGNLVFQWRRLLRKYPDCPVGRRIDLYMSRNTGLPAAEEDLAYTSEDKAVGLQISACMERARSQVLDTERQKEKKDELLERLQSDLKVVRNEVKGLKQSIDTIKPKAGP